MNLATKPTEEVEMDSQDRKEIRRKLIPILLFPFLIAGFLFLIFHFILNKMGDGMMADGVVKYVMIGFGMFFIAVIGYTIWSYFYDLRVGVKYRVTGLVTDKKLSIIRSNASSRKRSTKTTRHYHIFIDDVKYKMDYASYNTVKVGDQIKMDRGPKSGLILSLEILEAVNTSSLEKEAAADLSYLNTNIKPVPMTERDFNQLKNQHLGFVKKKVIWNLPMLIIIFWSIISGVGGLLLFVFPIVIIPAYQFYKIIKDTFRYYKNKSEGYKRGVTAIVDDKITITSNKNATKYKIKTTASSLFVPEEVYHLLSKNDKIVIFEPMFGHKPLSLITMNQKEYELN